MRTDYPFFTTIKNQQSTLAGDIRLLARVANDGLAVAAKDVSMPGPLGSLAMLLEYKRLGANIDIRKLPVPKNCELQRWLVAFPTYGFWLAAAPDKVSACCKLFESRGLACKPVGEVVANSELRLIDGRYNRLLLDLASETITGLWGRE